MNLVKTKIAVITEFWLFAVTPQLLSVPGWLRTLYLLSYKSVNSGSYQDTDFLSIKMYLLILVELLHIMRRDWGPVFHYAVYAMTGEDLQDRQLAKKSDILAITFRRSDDSKNSGDLHDWNWWHCDDSDNKSDDSCHMWWPVSRQNVVSYDQVTTTRVVSYDHVTTTGVVSYDHVTTTGVVSYDHVTTTRVVSYDQVTTTGVVS